MTGSSLSCSPTLPVSNAPHPHPAVPLRSPRAIYREHFADARRERLFLSSVAFFLTFAIVRTITYAIHAGRGPLHDVVVGGMHLHHLVWGILLLLGVSYLWLAQVGTGIVRSLDWPSRLTALLYGVGAALTLDEFALWLRLEDVYWAREGRESIDLTPPQENVPDTADKAAG